jgi:hypothetical protein
MRTIIELSIIVFNFKAVITFCVWELVYSTPIDVVCKTVIV